MSYENDNQIEAEKRLSLISGDTNVSRIQRGREDRHVKMDDLFKYP